MTDQLFLDPKQAQTALNVVAQQQGLFLTALDNFGQALVKLETNSLNDQISNADVLGAKLQAALGSFVAFSMSRYFDKLVEVFEKWRKSDFPTAQPVMYICFGFQPVQITGQCYIKTKVSLSLIKATADEL